MTNRPNILLIMSDQHRYDCVGRANDYPVETPNIDKLASQGMWFEHAYTPIPLCCPTRQAFLAGKRPEALGCHWNYDQNIQDTASRSRRVLLATRLEAGRVSLCIHRQVACKS